MRVVLAIGSDRRMLFALTTAAGHATGRERVEGVAVLAIAKRSNLLHLRHALTESDCWRAIRDVEVGAARQVAGGR